MNDQKTILTVNVGSSSIKLALFRLSDLHKELEAEVTNIGSAEATFISPNQHIPVVVEDHAKAAALLMEKLDDMLVNAKLAAIGHRVVHGGPIYYLPTVVNDEVVRNLKSYSAFDPEHLPEELNLIEIFSVHFPKVQQIACFDTAFHHDLPNYSRILPLPRYLERDGLRRYGFHGLSYAYILEDFRRNEGEAAVNGKLIIAHLGSGSSLAALNGGMPIDTTMALTPASGITMSTRSGDIDPGIITYLAHNYGYDIQQMNQLFNFKSGLLGISEQTADMKKLLEGAQDNDYARDAVDIFCYNVAKVIGGFSAALNGLNSLVFTGGIGENAPKIRSRICGSLGFLGVELDPNRNEAGERLISSDGARVGVHVIHTDESVTIARETKKLLGEQ